jgi:hypothetical protein
MPRWKPRLRSTPSSCVAAVHLSTHMTELELALSLNRLIEDDMRMELNDMAPSRVPATQTISSEYNCRDTPRRFQVVGVSLPTSSSVLEVDFLEVEFRKVEFRELHRYHHHDPGDAGKRGIKACQIYQISAIHKYSAHTAKLAAHPGITPSRHQARSTAGQRRSLGTAQKAIHPTTIAASN